MYTTHVRGAFLPAHSPPPLPPCRSLRAEAAAANSVWLLSKDPNNFEQGTSRNRSEEKRMWRGKESAEMREGNCFCYYISCKHYSFPFSLPPPTLSLGLSGKRGARTDGRALGPLPSTLHTFLSLFCTAEKKYYRASQPGTQSKNGEGRKKNRENSWGRQHGTKKNKKKERPGRGHRPLLILIHLKRATKARPGEKWAIQCPPNRHSESRNSVLSPSSITRLPLLFWMRDEESSSSPIS